MDHLITKYLEGELTLDEQHELSKWLQSDERNAETLKKVEAYWYNHKDSLHAEELEVRLRLQQMMDAEIESPIDQNHPLSWRGIYRFAAVFAIVLSAVFGVYKYNSIETSGSEIAAIRLIEKVSLPGQKVTTRLPDGTTVTLNAGSSISYQENFEGKTRIVNLSGEAFFEVERNPEKPFVINFRDQSVKVLGTSFNIRSYETETYSEVGVATGKVSFSHVSGNHIVLLPFEKANLKNGSTKFEKGKVNEFSDFGWRKRILYFESNSFDEIKAELERWYGVSIETNGLKPKGTYTGKFDNPTLNEILTGLSFIYRFEFQTEGSKVTLSKQIN